MKKTHKRLLATAVATAMAMPMAANATNGYFAHGVGIKAKGMAGAGIAYGQDAMAAGTNPANMVLVGNRIDFGVDAFMPDRSTQISGNGAPFNIGTKTYDPNDDDLFLIPEFGYNRMIDANKALGVSVYGNGGMNTSYKQSVAVFGNTNAGVNLEQLFVAPTFSMKVDDQNAFGVALNVIYQKFRATGLQNFDAGTATSEQGYVTNNGDDTSTGFNIRLGWTSEITDKLTLGVTYQSEADMSEFDDYKGLFAEKGDFDIPSTYGIGLKFKATPKMNIAFDITQINYSDIKAIANPLSGFTVDGNLLGEADSAGFGWEDMTAYKLGVDYQMNDNLVVRAGWNHGSQPIPAKETFFNLLAPGVVEDHLTLGATWTLENDAELSVMYMHAFENTVNGSNSIPSSYGGGEANLTMSQDSYGIAYGWDF